RADRRCPPPRRRRAHRPGGHRVAGGRPMTPQILEPCAIDRAPMTDAPADAPPPSARRIPSGLAAQILALAPEEQAQLGTMLDRATSNGHTARPFDVVSFVHRNLRALTDLTQHVPQDVIEAAVAPPMVKSWAAAAEVPLPRDLLPLDVELRRALSDRFSGRSF